MSLIRTVVGVLANDYDLHLSEGRVGPRINIFCCSRAQLLGWLVLFAKGNIREGYTLRFLALSSGPWTPSSHRNFFNEIKYGFLISSFRSFNLRNGSASAGK